MKPLLPALMIGALLLSGCELLEASDVQQVKNEIRDSTGVNVDSPTAVGGALLGAKFLGDKDSADGLTVIRAAQRVQHEQKGDQAYRRGDYAAAEQEYEEAVRWGGSKSVLANDHGQLNLLYGTDANQHLRQGNAAGAQLLFSKAGDEAVAQATYLADARSKSYAYMTATDDYVAAGDPAAACAALRKARAVPFADQTEYYRNEIAWTASKLAATGNTCN